MTNKVYGYGKRMSTGKEDGKNAEKRRGKTIKKLFNSAIMTYSIWDCTPFTRGGERIGGKG